MDCLERSRCSRGRARALGCARPRALRGRTVWSQHDRAERGRRGTKAVVSSSKPLYSRDWRSSYRYDPAVRAIESPRPNPVPGLMTFEDRATGRKTNTDRLELCCRSADIARSALARAMAGRGSPMLHYACGGVRLHERFGLFRLFGSGGVRAAARDPGCRICRDGSRSRRDRFRSTTASL